MAISQLAILSDGSMYRHNNTSFPVYPSCEPRTGWGVDLRHEAEGEQLSSQLEVNCGRCIRFWDFGSMRTASNGPLTRLAAMLTALQKDWQGRALAKHMTG